MKYYHLFFCCLLMSTVWSQDSAMLASWNNLTSAFAKRATTFENITQSLSKIMQVDSSTIRNVTERKLALKTLLDSDRLDSNFIQQVVDENKKLISSFSKVMNLMLLDPAFKSKKEAADFQGQLMTAENKIVSAKKRYNVLILAKNRIDLLYP